MRTPRDAVEVDARLDGEDRRRGQRLLRCRAAHGGQLVGGQADAMAGAVPEAGPLAGGLDDVAGGGVHLPVGDAAPGGDRLAEQLDGRLLGPRDELVDGQVSGRRLAHEERARHVGAVAVDPGTEVEEEHLTPSHGPLAGRAVGQRSPRAGQAGHVEGEAFCAAGPHAPLQGQRQLVLADTDADVRQRLAKSRISHGAGCADALRLCRLLDPALLLDEPLDGHQLHVRCRLSQAQPLGVAEEAGLDGHAPHAAIRGAADRPQAPEQLRPGIHEGADQVRDAAGRALLLGLEAIPRVGHHDRSRPPRRGSDPRPRRPSPRRHPGRIRPGSGRSPGADRDRRPGHHRRGAHAVAPGGAVEPPGPRHASVHGRRQSVPPPHPWSRRRQEGSHWAMLRLCCAAVLAKVCVSDPGQA